MTCGSEQKETVMMLKVDLDCCQCYKKVKKTLCKFPQIRNQVYDEKNNTVIITVLCCSPEKIRDKLCCKAGKSIKSIEIKQQSKPKPPPSEPEKPKSKPAPAEPEKPKQPPAPQPENPPKPEPAPAPEKIQKNGSKKGGGGGEPAPDPPKPAPKQDEPPAPKPTPKQAAPAPAPQTKAQEEPIAQWVPGYPPPAPPPQMYPVSVCCAQCYDGRPGGPCYHNGPYGYYGRPCPPPYGTRCDYYFSEENPSACSVM